MWPVLWRFFQNSGSCQTTPNKPGYRYCYHLHSIKEKEGHNGTIFVQGDTAVYKKGENKSKDLTFQIWPRSSFWCSQIKFQPPKFRYTLAGTQEGLKDGDNVQGKMNNSTWNTNESSSYHWAHVESGPLLLEGKWLNKYQKQEQWLN